VRGRESRAVEVYEVTCVNGALLRLRRLASGNVQIALAPRSAGKNVCNENEDGALAELDTGNWSALMGLREQLWPIRPRNRKKKGEAVVS
jgi:hypothetical protein